jgi:hypothetical protein
MLDKAVLLELLAQARKRAESGDFDISAQHEIITALEQKGLDSDKARLVLGRLIDAQESDLTEMERLLDQMDKQDTYRS